MWFRSLLASWKPWLSRNPRQQPARRATRLVLEYLEDRALPSAYSAASVSDLIADISAANTAGGKNTITLTALTTSPYALTTSNNNGNAYGPNGLPVIAANDNLTIIGNGDTIERTVGQYYSFRLFSVAPLGSLALENLTLKGGLAARSTAAGLSGGAIYNLGTLTLSSVTVAHNQAGIASSGASAYGGAIWSNGSLTLENGTLLESNVASAGGGGSFNFPEYPGPSWPPGHAFGGAVDIAGGTANITNTTFTGNLATANETGAFGGALYVAAGQVILTNATVNNNTARAYEGPPSAYGGGLYVAGGTVTLANDTMESPHELSVVRDLPILGYFGAKQVLEQISPLPQ